jgi:hypothetical protein
MFRGRYTYVTLLVGFNGLANCTDENSFLNDKYANLHLEQISIDKELNLHSEICSQLLCCMDVCCYCIC